MVGHQRVLRVVACGAAVMFPAVGSAAQVVKHDFVGERTTMGRVPSGAATLLVTFSDRPTASQAAARLSGLGQARALVPEIGVWELTPVRPATARAAAARRDRVVAAEWSFARRADVLPPRRAAIPALAPVVVSPPTDPMFGSQPGMGGDQWTPSLTGHAGRPRIAVLDTGLDRTHPEWSQSGLVVAPWNSVTRSASAPDGGVEGHGSHVAGIAAAPADGVGMVGVAPVSTSPAMPNARIIPVKITFRFQGSDVSTDASQMAGIRHAVLNGAKVINISSGGPGFNQAYQDTVNWAMRRGTLIVASVGNSGDGPNPLNYPAGYDHVIGVAANCNAATSVDCPTAFGRARFSNSNFSVDLMAPGVDISSTVPSRVAPGGYAQLTGTSMASPYVAGAAALVYASHPGISPFQVTRLLESTAGRAQSGLQRNDLVGWGKVSPIRAVTATAPIDDLAEPNDDVQLVPTTHNVVLTSSQRRFSVTARADYFDDQMDVYAVPMSRGRRIKVTITANGSGLWVNAYRGPGRVSPNVMSLAQFNRRVVGETRRATPGSRALVFTAPATGRYWIQVIAARGTGGEYKLAFERLN